MKPSMYIHTYSAFVGNEGCLRISWQLSINFPLCSETLDTILSNMSRDDNQCAMISITAREIASFHQT